MHRSNRRSILLAAVLFSGTLVAQEDPVFRSDTRLVVLNATVVDAKGNIVTDLPRSAFKVFENSS